ncbi:hypothetical protein DACRYDRAFT_104067 [Dacryopinax primogenitus]|uniref:UPF3 domain-containing protein n=1 Tax=Dacryopinax primogenitus (strain DJM 731) TaxID=1858805 RepID=M5GB11_DACPD|nr:uncharacterized protein DACRYDRAFT_104067 [Dacryopinax primogenitus]EJU05580.1 hypothetical protein DACRYDRAFT_104067 [Dacryopinax primogenitus]
MSMAKQVAASSSPAASPASAPASSKSSKKKRGQETVSATRLKVIVRRLPPNLPEAVFWKSVEPWVNEENTTWRIFYSGKIKPKLENENVPSRAYIMFKTPEQVAQFSSAYNGHAFRDKQGRESQAVVEFAPYQKVPITNVKPDVRQGTIDQDPDFMSFMTNLNAPVEYESLASLEKGVSQAPALEPVIAPLIEALIQQKKATKGAKAAAKAAAAQAPTVASRQAAAVASQQAAMQAAAEEKAVYSRKLPGEAGPSVEPPPPKPKKGKQASEPQPTGDDTARKRPVVGANRQFDAALGAATGGRAQPRTQEKPSAATQASTAASTPAQPAAQPAPGKGKTRRGKGGGQAPQATGGPSQSQGAPQSRADAGQGGRGRGRGRGAPPPPQVQPGMIQIASRPAANAPISRIDMQPPNQVIYSSTPGEGAGGDGRPVRNAVAAQMIDKLRTGGGGRGRGRGSPGRGGASGALPG